MVAFNKMARNQINELLDASLDATIAALLQEFAKHPLLYAELAAKGDLNVVDHMRSVISKAFQPWHTIAMRDGMILERSRPNSPFNIILWYPKDELAPIDSYAIIDGMEMGMVMHGGMTDEGSVHT